jgi:hypothetical protein
MGPPQAEPTGRHQPSQQTNITTAWTAHQIIEAFPDAVWFGRTVGAINLVRRHAFNPRVPESMRGRKHRYLAWLIRIRKKLGLPNR